MKLSHNWLREWVKPAALRALRASRLNARPWMAGLALDPENDVSPGTALQNTRSTES